MASFQSHQGFNERINIQSHQSAHLPKGLKTEYVRIPSQSQAAWGSSFQINLNTKRISLEELVLEFSLPAISGLTVSNSGTAAFLPAFFFVNRIELLIGTTVIDTITSLGNFLMWQLFSSTEKLKAINAAAGDYASHTTRATKSSAAGYWYLPIYSVFDTANVSLLGSQDVSLRIQMANLADSYSLTSGETATGTAAGTIVACNLLAKVTHLNDQIVNSTLAVARKANLHHVFLEERYQSFSVAQSATSATCTLTGIQGCVPFLAFVVRTSAPANAARVTWISTITSVEILGDGSNNICGGSILTADQARYLIGKVLPNTTLTDQDQIVFYPFCSDPVATAERAIQTGAYNFKGNEQVKITFSTGLSAASQVDVVAWVYSALEVGQGNARKIALSV